MDSSVAAYLLKEQGYEVVGVTMQIWQDEDETVQSGEWRMLRTQCGRRCQKSVAHDLGIPYYVMNFKAEFQDKVMDYFAGGISARQDTKSLYMPVTDM